MRDPRLETSSGDGRAKSYFRPAVRGEATAGYAGRTPSDHGGHGSGWDGPAKGVKCKVTLYNGGKPEYAHKVIESFRHKGLRKLFEDDDRRKVPAAHGDKIGRILARLNEAVRVQDMRLPGHRLHPLKGELAGFWSVSVSGNLRIVFRFESGAAYDVDLIDYH